ncbi:site-specific DNA-methyltransferase, partial [Chelativorans sp.]|uniref:site-specific DNA-methyltransferase n=1 Tax=Chelativorans sp. TaxID=2203393 RepID=UPI00281162D2
MNVLDQAAGEGWAAYNADTVEFTAEMPSNSIDLSVYSPPFSSLYIYSESERDMGNVASHEEFFASYRHLVREKLRVTRPGRLSAIHVKDLVYYSNSSEKGDRGLYHFTGECIRTHVEEGWTFHRLITVWRCPVKEMQKTKADRLLYKHFRTDAARTGGGMPEYIAVFRKWAEGMEVTAPVVHPPERFPLEVWQEWASPVWMNTRETDVLNVGAKGDEERHRTQMP